MKDNIYQASLMVKVASIGPTERVMKVSGKRAWNMDLDIGKDARVIPIRDSGFMEMLTVKDSTFG